MISSSGGLLEADTSGPIENICYPQSGPKPPSGLYTVAITVNSDEINVNYTVRINNTGTIIYYNSTTYCPPANVAWYGGPMTYLILLFID